MTAFAFILGVVPLLTAAGAGAEARKVMGMAVFSGMLVATILGVLLIPMLYVVVETDHRRRKHAPVPAAPDPRRAGHRARTGRSLRCASGRSFVASRRRWRRLGRCRPAAPRRPELRAAADADAAAISLRRRHRRRPQSLADSPWFQVFDDPTLQALIREAIGNNLDLQTAAGARRGGARPRRHRQVVPLSAG